MKPRAAWPVLVKKSKEAVDKARADVVKMREHLQKLQSNHARYLSLLQEYQQRCLVEERTALTIDKTRNYRGFMQQIQGLVDRVHLEMTTAEHQMTMLKKALQAAEHKQLQMETLEEQDKARVASYLRQKSQKEMDAAGIQGHQLRMRRA